MKQWYAVNSTNCRAKWGARAPPGYGPAMLVFRVSIESTVASVVACTRVGSQLALEDQ